MTSKLTERRREFSANVWNHSADAFQMSFDAPSVLEKPEMDALTALLKDALVVTEAKASKAKFDQTMRQMITDNPKIVNRLVQLLGLTRNKVIQDIKAYVRSTQRAASISSLPAAIAHEGTWPLIADYFRPRVVALAATLGKNADYTNSLLAINLVTWSGYIRQERAKRMGHEAERRAAELLYLLGISFQPEAKRLNPLCPDIQINGISFDLVVPNSATPRIVVKATVHTANIGQYGESKDHLELTEALESISKMGKVRPLLVACVDGVGFESNRAGLNGVLETADEFFQFKTIWKLVAIAAKLTQTPVVIGLAKESLSAHRQFIDQYRCKSVEFIDIDDASTTWTTAGEAKITSLS